MFICTILQKNWNKNHYTQLMRCCLFLASFCVKCLKKIFFLALSRFLYTIYRESAIDFTGIHGVHIYNSPSIMQQHTINPPYMGQVWGGVGGFTTPPVPTPPLCAPPLTVASSLGNPQMPSSSTYNTNSPMGYNFR